MSIDTQEDLNGLSRVGKVVALTLRETRKQVRSGVTTAELDRVAKSIFDRYGARSAPRLVYGFPGNILISVNDEVVHGIPGKRIIEPGDLVKIDVTAELDGYIADAADTLVVGPTDRWKNQLSECARSAFWKAMRVARAGLPLNGVGAEVESEVSRRGFSVIRPLTGHGVGRTIHEWPTVPNFQDFGVTGSFPEGLVITVEPIICAGSGRVREDSDGWTIRTADRSLAAHFEHTIVITGGRPILLTA